MAKKPGKYYLSAAEKSDRITVKNGKGDHFKCSGVDDNGIWTMTQIPYNLKGDGTECSIKKWFLRFGIVLSLVLGVIGYFWIT